MSSHRQSHRSIIKQRTFDVITYFAWTTKRENKKVQSNLGVEKHKTLEHAEERHQKYIVGFYDDLTVKVKQILAKFRIYNK